MVVTSFTQEFETPVAPARMFKALVVDSHNLIPTLLPQFIKSIECVEGDGSAGSITQTNFSEGGQLRYLKYKINVLDEEALHCKYTLIDGDVFDDKLEYVVYDVKFEECSNGGCIWKMTSEYHTKGDFQLQDDEINEAKEKVNETYKVIQEYLLQNPHVYA